jgi:1-phosphofructokinase family hexose kinase
VITALAPSPSVDVTYAVPGLRLGAVNRPSAVHRLPGGKGLNVARAAHRLGADVVAVALLAGEGGAWIRREMAAIGVPLRAVTGTSATRTCISLADDGAHTMTEVYEPAGPVTAAEWDRFTGAARRALARRPGWVTLSGSLPPGAPDGAAGALVELAKRAGRAVVVDLHGAALREALDARPDAVKVNAAEAAEVLGGGDAVEDLARALAARTRVGAVVTAGVDGAVAVTADGAARRVRSARRGPYPVGSGDCFLAGLAVALDVGRGLLDGLPAAAAAATANALVPGPACFTDEDLRAAPAGLETVSP